MESQSNGISIIAPDLPQISAEFVVDWSWAKRMALCTEGKKPITPQPTDKQKRQWLMAEHSHIKMVQYCINLKDLRQWVGVHLLRHPFMLAFISSQRADRASDPDTEADRILSIIKSDIVNDDESLKARWRDFRLQGSGNDHTFILNAQTLINISRKRLCKKASMETRLAWVMVRNSIYEIDPVMADFMVPNCIYRGFCPEIKTCGYTKSENYDSRLTRYHSLINNE